MRLYVGNFVYTTTEQELKDFFTTQGAVENVRIIRDQFTRQSRCFGYVQMLTRRGGENAINALHGKSFKNQHIIVKKDKKI